MAHQQRTSTRDAAPTQARRVTAAVVDALIALLCGLTAGTAAGIKVVDGLVELQPQSPTVWATALGVAVAVSLFNHVLLTLASRASLAKLLTGLRVVRASDGGRPGFLRLVGRWLFGFYWMVVFVPIHVVTDSGVEQQDAVGLRIVRRTARS
ncbi:RDD family protein [Streptomyces sp. NBC_01381]|uniref:RDD family protein n=1 Tax=Streptomyces sp. NBC_01381 TaxID=2903845 RepID=UPI002256C65D|nr:RDD family protein [Streptomyces sp. NBC_01381]MCX4665233.1 RDD family protein [Streptomyces sp. NBC_01381]